MKQEFPRQIKKKTQMPNLMKIGPVGAKLLHEEGWTDRHDEASSNLSQYCERA
jgi:hypothetical protein